MYLPAGIIPPVPTFVTEDFAIDYRSMENAIDYHIEKGVDGLFFLGTGGEFVHLSTEERKEIATYAVQYTNGRVPVLIGTGTPSTRETKQLNKHAHEVGADAVVVINPYYFKLDETHLYQHFDDIFKESKLPVLLYNFPALTGQDIPAHMIKQLVENHENFVGIKNTVDSLTHTKDIISATKQYEDRFSVLAGFDDYVLGGLSLGCKGAINGTGNIAPDLSTQLYQAYQTGDYQVAEEHQQKISELCKIYHLDQPFIGVIKEAMYQAGIEVQSQTLPPVQPVGDEQKEEISRILREAGIFS
ncbi:dihydrodipicolinate synthase family protein [Texcoconibacillus texcoconensis]|uniref:4-hydroxy-tetrahydrodipicolinate synthase n=1 Tax=Texcoconibacillus texcoconensis TaxID=1095777 RepID=A0A840QR93_9BACI|nr:dihydrodipicolinate synthase family protein [Texcoconibacillus texcoconensis]MBB5173843.1 4-hydroxy-tetrahydrodipicolinate synthase [Texcoconibacillus texcoconensis]